MRTSSLRQFSRNHPCLWPKESTTFRAPIQFAGDSFGLSTRLKYLFLLLTFLFVFVFVIVANFVIRSMMAVIKSTKIDARVILLIESIIIQPASLYIDCLTNTNYRQQSYYFEARNSLNYNAFSKKKGAFKMVYHMLIEQE